MKKVSLPDGKSISVENDGILSYYTGQFKNGNPFKILFASESGDIENDDPDIKCSALFVGNSSTVAGDSVTHQLLTGNKIVITYESPLFRMQIKDENDTELFWQTFSSAHVEDLHMGEYYAVCLRLWMTTNGLAGGFYVYRKYENRYENLTDLSAPYWFVGQILPEEGDRFVTLKKGRTFSFDNTPGESAYRVPELVIPKKDDNTDPYAHGGTSSIGGGGGNYDGASDSIAIPSLPTLSAVDAGFITIYKPSLSIISSLAQYLWSDYPIDTFRKLFADPMDAILGLSIVPFEYGTGIGRNIKVGNVDTGIFSNVAFSQYTSVNCGNLSIPRYFGAYLDYDPYTKFEIFLPFIGTRAMSADDVVGKTLNVTYHIDLLTGSCVAFVKCNNSVIYSYSGQCATSIPITARDWTNVINGTLSVATSIGTTVASGGETLPITVSSIASNVVNHSKPQIQKSGSMSGGSAILGIKTPYLIITRPIQAVAEHQNKFIGYPSFIERKLGDLIGLYKVKEIHLENMTATAEEVNEIENLLKGGVIA